MRFTRIGASSSARVAVKGDRGGGRGDDPRPTPDPAAAGPAHEQQRPAGPHPAGGVARDLERQRQVLADARRDLGAVHLEQGPVVRASGRDHHMVDRRWEARRRNTRGAPDQWRRTPRAPRADIKGCPFEPLGIAAGEDDVGTLGAGRRAVSSPMPALPPITTTVWPSSSGSRRFESGVVAVLMQRPCQQHVPRGWLDQVTTSRLEPEGCALRSTQGCARRRSNVSRACASSGSASPSRRWSRSDSACSSWVTAR